jgi:hypothetical protein
MRKIHLLGLALVAVFAFGAMTAASAFAEVGMEWLLHEEAVTAETAVGAIMTEGLLELTDLKVPIFGSATVDCEGLGEGTIGPNGKDLITSIVDKEGKNPLKCTGVKTCEGATEVVPLDLPWETQIILNGTEPRDELLQAGKGEPGYEVVNCKTSLGTQKDDCSGPTSQKLENMPTESDVLSIFDANSAKGNCTIGGTGAGDITGELLIFDVEGLLLEVS